MPRILPVLCFCFAIAAGGCASARTGTDIAAVFDTGVADYDAGRYEEAFKIWWGLKDEDVAAMRNVAMMLRKGQGTAKDPQKAEEIYQTAAEAGLPTAQADLADMLLKGEAGPPDLERALPLLKAAAAGNHPIAQFQLGELYETGAPPYVEKNTDVARRLYAAAAGHGMKDAKARLDFLGGPLPVPATTQTIAIPSPPPLESPSVPPATP